MSRLAYVIGINDYTYWGKLVNPINDVYAMEDILSKAGFMVKVFTDLDNHEFSRVIYEFGSDLINYTTGLFYFAGHGIENSGNNYIIPKNGELSSAERIVATSINISNLVEQLSSHKDLTSIIILDSCRTNINIPSTRGIIRSGITKIEAPSGTFVSYSTSPNCVASDGRNGKNGLFTEVLCKYLLKPGQSIEGIFKMVRREVQHISDGRQVPWEHSSLTGDFFFVESSLFERFRDVFLGDAGQNDQDENSTDNKKHYADEDENEVEVDVEEIKQERDNLKHLYERMRMEISGRIDLIQGEEFYILSKRKTITFKRNTLQWWKPRSDGYTELLDESGVFSKKDVKQKVVPYSPDYCLTTNIAIPIDIVKSIYKQNVIPFNDDNIGLLEHHKENIVGDLDWNLPRIVLS